MLKITNRGLELDKNCLKLAFNKNKNLNDFNQTMQLKIIVNELAKIAKIENVYIISDGIYIYPRVCLYTCPYIKNLPTSAIFDIRESQLPFQSQFQLCNTINGIKLFNYQSAAINHVLTCEQFLKTGVIYLQMGTGTGKTRVGAVFAYLINSLDKPSKSSRTLIVVPTIAIQNQWKDEITQLFPHICVRTSINKKNITFDFDILILVINTARIQNDQFMTNFNLLILDEAHEYHSTVNCNVLKSSQIINYTIGLSATPNEVITGSEPRVKMYLGEPLYLSDITDIKSMTFQTKVYQIKTNFKFDRNDFDGFEYNKMLSILEQDPDRNQLIFDVIMQLYKRNHNILVFCHHRKFVEFLKNRLDNIVYDPEIDGNGDLTDDIYDSDSDSNDEYLVNADDEYLVNADDKYFGNIDDEHLVNADNENGINLHEYNMQIDEDIKNQPIQFIESRTSNVTLLYGGSTSETLKHAHHKRIVVLTYGYGRRGLSLKNMTALVMVTSKKTGIEQIVGRIMRKGSDETIIREIADITDTKTFLRSHYDNRIATYKKLNFEICDSKELWS